MATEGFEYVHCGHLGAMDAVTATSRPVLGHLTVFLGSRRVSPFHPPTW